MNSLTRAGIAAGLLTLAAGTNAAYADLYLNGILLYHADSANGQSAGGHTEWDSMNTPNADMFINGVTATPLLLSAGDNFFAMTIPGWAWPGTSGLGMFFSTDATLITDFDRVPDLIVYGSGGAFNHPAAGTIVNTLGQFSAFLPYSGAVSHSAGGFTATVTEFRIDSFSNTGFLTIRVVPAPASLGMLGLAGLCARRRRR